MSNDSINSIVSIVASDDTVTLAHSSGSRASVTPYGAQVLSWVDRSGLERLYLSRLARSDHGTPIRGGIPVIFPQFGTGPLPKHGLLRTRRWLIASHTASAAKFRSTDDDATRALWPYPFLAELTVELSQTLRLSLAITNTGDSHFDFAAALHNYFAVESIAAARVIGLHGLTYIDKTAGNARRVADAPKLQIHAETDRIYTEGPREVTIEHAIASSSTRVEASSFGDWVVWNPWREATATLADMEPEDYQHMLCVEAARVIDLVGLEPGSTWVGEEVIIAT